MATTVLIVSDIRLYREGLRLVLRDEPRINVVGTASNVDEAVTRVRDLTPYVSLVDLAMQEGYQAIRQMADLVPSMKVLALSVLEAESEVIACAEAGVAGYISRDGSTEDLVKSVEMAAKGELFCSPRMAALLTKRVKAAAFKSTASGLNASLTRRESRVLELLEQGLSNKQIARVLKIELATVKNHVHNILEKFQVHSRGEAVATARSRCRGPQPHIGQTMSSY